MPEGLSLFSCPGLRLQQALCVRVTCSGRCSAPLSPPTLPGLCVVLWVRSGVLSGTIFAIYINASNHFKYSVKDNDYWVYDHLFKLYFEIILDIQKSCKKRYQKISSTPHHISYMIRLLPYLLLFLTIIHIQIFVCLHELSPESFESEFQI